MGKSWKMWSRNSAMMTGRTFMANNFIQSAVVIVEAYLVSSRQHGGQREGKTLVQFVGGIYSGFTQASIRGIGDMHSLSSR